MRSSFSLRSPIARLTARGTVVLSIATASFMVFAQSSQLRLVSTVWPPFTNQPGQPRFALDLVEAAFGRLGITTRTTIVDAAQFTPALLEGEFDGSAAAWRDPERDRVLLFSQPYLENRLVLIGRKGSDVSAPALSALKGKRIAIVGGYSYGNAIDEATSTFVRSRNEEDSLSLLLAGSVDYALMDELVVQYIVDNYPKEAGTKLQLGSTPLVTRELHLAIRRTRPDAESIISRFNAQLRGMIADRTYHRLLHVAWIRADVDGDGIPEFVPQSDRAGTLQPQRAYTLFSNPQPTPELSVETPPPTQPRFYIGGSIYTDWATVPSRYKNDDQRHPDPSRSTASIFRFSW
jgi:polar amino acid transport system substrate-binding protein